MSMADLPEWVWQVVEATQKYDDEHPLLFRELPGGGYDQVHCLDSVLKPLIPAEVWQAAQVMRERRARLDAEVTG
jgi:hypothetical protein